MDLKLKNKTALVTGSSRGIGEGIAKSLSREGVHVMIHGRNQQELQRVVQEITKEGGVVHSVEGDLIHEEAVNHIVDFTIKTFKQLDILVNNAGAFPKRGWMECTPQSWLELFDINVVSMVRLIQAFLPQMKALGWGRDHSNFKCSGYFAFSSTS